MFWWTDTGVEKRVEGRVRDISEKGVFVVASTRPPLGTEVGFKFFFPAFPGFEPRTHVEALGEVLRVEQGDGGKKREGFAILTRHTLLRVNSNSDCDESEPSGTGDWN
jgi:PilZ domain-containing protein